MSKSYILVGSIPTNDPKSHGGTTILVQQMLDYFHEHHKDYIFIQTNWYSGKFASLINFLYVLYMFFKNIRQRDIVFANVARNGAYYLSPVLLFLTKLFKKQFVFRLFGGSLIDHFSRSNKLKKMLLSYVFYHSDILFFEPKYLVSHFKKIVSNVYWFPNTRKQSTYVRDSNRKYEKKFIYIGQIRQGKGIDEILEASKFLDSSYSIELYGTIVEKKYGNNIWNKYPNVEYCGEFKPIEVYKVLSEHDVLLLPSEREGYPGVIIEAFSVGLPVIATGLESIREMVTDNCAILVEVNEVTQLAEAMMSIKESEYKEMCSNALKKFEDFDYERVYQSVINVCEENSR